MTKEQMTSLSGQYKRYIPESRMIKKTDLLRRGGLYGHSERGSVGRLEIGL